MAGAARVEAEGADRAAGEPLVAAMGRLGPLDVLELAMDVAEELGDAQEGARGAMAGNLQETNGVTSVITPDTLLETAIPVSIAARRATSPSIAHGERPWAARKSRKRPIDGPRCKTASKC